MSSQQLDWSTLACVWFGWTQLECEGRVINAVLGLLLLQRSIWLAVFKSSVRMPSWSLPFFGGRHRCPRAWCGEGCPGAKLPDASLHYESEKVLWDLFFRAIFTLGCLWDPHSLPMSFLSGHSLQSGRRLYSAETEKELRYGGSIPRQEWWSMICLSVHWMTWHALYHLRRQRPKAKQHDAIGQMRYLIVFYTAELSWIQNNSGLSRIQLTVNSI